MKLHIHERSLDILNQYVQKYLRVYDPLAMLSTYHRRLKGAEFLRYSDRLFKDIGNYFLDNSSRHNILSVRLTYMHFAREVLSQFDFLISSGVRFVFGDDKLFDDKPNYEKLLQFYEHEGYLPVKKTGIDDAHPILSKVGFKYSADDALIKPDSEVTNWNVYQHVDANDLFRAVHDVFGHFASGGNFGIVGERVAYAKHYPVFSPEARYALAAETMAPLSAWKIKGKVYQENKALDIPVRLHGCGLYIPY